jgi:hypothetical protein
MVIFNSYVELPEGIYGENISKLGMKPMIMRIQTLLQ